MTNNWMTVGVKFVRQLEDGTFKRVSEKYLLAAMNFTDAEQRIYEELGALIRGEFIVSSITRTDVHDLFHYEDSDVWYKCIIKFQQESDGESKAKKVSQTMLVTADSVPQAHSRIVESLQGMMIDYQITDVVMSPIVDVFPFGDSSVDSDFEQLVKKGVADQVTGTKTVFSVVD